jgi:hypothetical protein
MRKGARAIYNEAHCILKLLQQASCVTLSSNLSNKSATIPRINNVSRTNE